MEFVTRSDQDHDPYDSQPVQQHVYSGSEQYQAQSAHYPPSHYSSLGAHVPQPSQSALAKQALPEVGQTRCYWTLLDSSLKFIVLDPVLTYHLRDQSTKFLEASLLDFVHPEERDTARQDLGSVLEERTLHGSVTRVRYCRLSKIRRLLGFKTGSPPYPPSFPADSIAIDNDYMAVYLVINCVAEGLVLCFLHAVVDLPPQFQNQSNGWTNHCSTYGFEEEQARALYQKVYETVPPSQPPYRLSPDSSLRIFQILRDQPNRPLVLSWPPEDTIMQSIFITPSAQELARLALHVQIDYSLASRSSGEGEVMTNCTQRYKTVQSVDVQTSTGVKCVQVESIFISHGTIIFACHKVEGKNPKDISDRDLGIPGQQNAFPYGQAAHSDNHAFYNATQVPYGSTYYTNMVHGQQLSSQNYVEQWVEGQNQEDFYVQQTRGQQQHWGQLPVPRDSSSSGMNQISQTRSSSASTVVQSTYYQDQWSSHERYTDSSTPLSSGVSYVRSQTPSHASSNETFVTNANNPAPPPSFTTDNPSVAKAPGNVKTESPTSNEVLPQGRQSPASMARPLHGGNGKGLGTPPVGVSQCSSCQTTHSPEWRKGPSGKKDLCNACGLRYARSRAKKEGVITRRRKDKDKRPSSTTRSVKHSSSVSSLGSRAAAQSYVRSQHLAESEDADASGAGLGGTLRMLRPDAYRSQHSAPPPDSLGSSPSPPLYPYYTAERTACTPQANSRQMYSSGEPYYDAIPHAQDSGSFYQSTSAVERVSSPTGAVYAQSAQQYPLRYSCGNGTVDAAADGHTHGRARGHGHAPAPHTPPFIDNRKLGPPMGSEVLSNAAGASASVGSAKQRGNTNMRVPYLADETPYSHHADDRFDSSSRHVHAPPQEKMGIEVPVRNNDYVW